MKIDRDPFSLKRLLKISSNCEADENDNKANKNNK